LHSAAHFPFVSASRPTSLREKDHELELNGDAGLPGLTGGDNGDANVHFLNSTSRAAHLA